MSVYKVPIRYLSRVFIREGLWGPPLAQLQREAQAATGWKTAVQTAQRISPAGAFSLVAELINGPWRLTMAPDSFDLAWAPSTPAPTIDESHISFADFVKEVQRIFGELIDKLNLPANRLALVREGFVTWPDAVPGGLMTLPPIFRDPKQAPFEWFWRCAGRVERQIGADALATNTLITIQRLSGDWSKTNERFDDVRVDLDINTAPSESVRQFDSAQASMFFEVAADGISELDAQVARLLQDAGQPA